MSNVSGAANRPGSRLAAPITAITSRSAGTWTLAITVSPAVTAISQLLQLVELSVSQQQLADAPPSAVATVMVSSIWPVRNSHLPPASAIAGDLGTGNTRSPRASGAASWREMVPPMARRPKRHRPLNGNGALRKPGCQAIATVGPFPARAIPDGGENAIPQPGPRRQRRVDGVFALPPLVVILAA